MTTKTILITGCSSGFGLETASHFLDRDWNVIATMRSPDKNALRSSANLRILPLDVTDPASIEVVVAEAGPIDALVNNAGVGLMSIFEGTPMTVVRSILDTNLVGAMAVTQAFLPTLRAQKGVLVNVSSGVTFEPLPLLATYTASKAALNAFTECLALELEPQGVRTRLVLPGRSPETPFGSNAQALMRERGVDVPGAYRGFVEQVMNRRIHGDALVTTAVSVADAVWRAVTDPSCPFRVPAGDDAVARAGETA